MIKHATNHKVLQYEYTKQELNYSFLMEESCLLKDEFVVNSYSQNIQIDLLSKFKSTSGFVFDCRTSDHKFILDNALKQQEQLTAELTAITERLVLGINQQGSIVDLNNHNEVLEKWEKLEIKLKSNFQGHLAEGYIDMLGEKIISKPLLIKDIKEYRLYGFLFNGFLRLPRRKGSTIQRDRIWKNTIHCLPINVTEEYQLLKEDVKTGSLIYRMSGKLQAFDKETLDRIKNYFKYYGIPNSGLYLRKYNGLFVINPTTAYLEKAILGMELTNDRGYERIIKLKLKQN